MLTDYPVRFADPAVQQTLSLLQTIYREPEIAAVVQNAELPVYEIAFDPRADLTWRSVFDVAAGQQRVGELLDVVAERYPGLRIRLEELRAAEPIVMPKGVVPPAQQTAAGWKNFSADGQAEAIIIAGQPTFVDVAFLAVGLARSRGVCRLTSRFPAGSGSGTGFRVGERHLLTNYHVLFDLEHGEARAAGVEAWFNYEDDEAGNPKQITQIRCRADSIVGERADDWAIVEADVPIPDSFPALAIEGSATPKIDDRVYIIQHPGGGPKQVAFQHNLVRDVQSDILQYWTDTDLGSSGSPVFDEHWNVVGLHHFSLPAPAGDKISVRNQGRRIDRVVSRIRALGTLPELT